jgi:release factor glutamine methyltransferase
VVEQSLKYIKNIKRPQIYDIAAGSGAIGLSLLKARPDSKLVASDISAQALEILAINAKNLAVKERVEILEGDLLACFEHSSVNLAHLVVCNPPYIRLSDYEQLASDVKNYEPRLALVAEDEQGIIFYRRLLAEAYKFMHDAGYIIFEVGYDQSELVAQLGDKAWRFIEIFYDLGGRPRGVVMQKRKRVDKQ